MGNEHSSSGYQNAVVLQQDDSLWKIEKVDKDPPVCLFTSIIELEKCKEGLKILRVLRHPNILKFLSSCPPVSSPGPISFHAELVFPLQGSLASQQLEGIVRGWRDVGCGLEFIHNKVGLSHNNLHVGCVFVGGQDSKWKIGGFEIATQLKKCTKQFFSSVSSVRHRDAIPPEDETDEDDDPQRRGIDNNGLIHSRDTWAFGNLMLQTLEDMNNEEDVTDDMIYYINNEMLNQSPQLRPSIGQIMLQSFMKNTTTHIIDFLTNLTMKQQVEKDDFFRSLACKLHSLPVVTVSEHIVPLILNPLVMAEPLASENLWEHLLCPVSDNHPRNNEFKPNEVNPILDEDQFKCHILPLLFNLLESREYHVRLILLHHLHFFCYLCTHEDLVALILPEVLVGLKDSHDDIVAATLHALAELVPLIGSEVVMGTKRKTIFSDSRPKIKSISSHVYMPSKAVIVRHDSPSSMIKEKKRDTKGRVGVAGFVGAADDTTTESDSSLVHQYDNKPLPQQPIIKKYSPSASIDDLTEHPPQIEKERKTVGHRTDEENEWEGFEEGGGSGTHVNDWGNWKEEDEENDTMNERATTHPPSHPPSQILKGAGSKPDNGTHKKDRKAMTLGDTANKQGRLLQTQKSTDSIRSATSSKSDEDSALRKKMKGQLSEEDLKRLEEKAQWNKNVDLFADMEPQINKTVRHTITTGTTGTATTTTGTVTTGHVKSSSSSIEASSTVKLGYQYNPVDTEEAWGDEGWSDVEST